MSEHTSSGLVAFEARYAGDRFNSYRAYKFADFVGTPAEPPRLVVRSYAAAAAAATGGQMTLFAVSWNGATEVRTWVFFGCKDKDNDDNSSSRFIEIGRPDRTGFETTFASPRFWTHGYAQALAANGSVIGESVVVTTHVVEGALHMASQGAGAGARTRTTGSLLKASFIFILGLVLGCLGSAGVMVLRRGNGRAGRAGYRPVGSGDEMSIWKAGSGGGDEGPGNDKDD